MQTISVGRIVRYVLPNGEHRPAIVTRVVDGDTVGLHLFLDAADAPFEPIDEATGQPGVVRYSEAAKVNTWHWPPRT